jgi:hypothetical protein
MIIGLAIAVVLLIGLIVLAVLLGATRRRMRRLEGHYRHLMAGAEDLDMAAALDVLMTRVDSATAEAQALRTATAAFEGRLDSAVQHMGMVRFNPFGDTGGDLSFALAMADAHGDGALLSNLHGRGESRFYAKPLEGWQSPYPLSDEEREAIVRARSSYEGRAAAAEANGATDAAAPAEQ